MTDEKGQQVKWSEIDKVRFYGIGTAMYTVITLNLHPITVMKTRQQILPSTNTKSSSFIKSSHKNLMEKIKIYYRGVGIILLLAVPARGIYIGVLENSKENMSSIIQSSINESPFLSSTIDVQTSLPFIASVSGGMAGGLAAMASQSITVPMDVISQKQMVMEDSMYRKEGSAYHVIKKILHMENGIYGLYRGLGMSLFTSLPSGSLWWGTYSGSQQLLQRFEYFDTNNNNQERMEISMDAYIHDLFKSGLKQGICGVSAAIVAATLTQPLDVIKTRLQVGAYYGQSSSLSASPKQMNNTYSTVVKDLYTSSGYRGFFRGLNPRIASFCLWGTVLSSAYEYLRHISKRDYEFFPEYAINPNNQT